MVSAPAPPPTSRKLAAAPPTSDTTSRVDITRPAPLPMMPTEPSSLMKLRSRSRAISSIGSSVKSSRKSSKSGWRKKAFESRVTLASRATISPVGGQDERVHLDEVAVELDEGPVQRRSRAADLAGRRPIQSGPVHQFATPASSVEPDHRVDVQSGDGIRGLGGDRLDVHAALGADTSPGAAWRPGRG